MASAVDASTTTPAPPPSDQQLHPSTSSLPSPITPAKTNQDLAALLTQAYGENDALRKELAQMKRRADKAERLAQSLTAVADGTGPNGNGAATNGTASSGLSESTVRLIKDLEERLTHAEVARDESETKRRMLLEHWAQVDGYLGTLEYKSVEARTNFGRILRESAFGPPGASFMPPPSSSKHSRHGSRSGMGVYPPPSSSPTTTRRPRTPSMDSAYPPAKRSRGEDYPLTPRLAYSESAIHDPRQSLPNAIRVIQPPHPHAQGPRTHTRGSSHSSASSMDVDEMLLRTAVDERGNPSNGAVPAALQAQASTQITSSHRTRAPRSQPAPRPSGEDPSQQQVFARPTGSVAPGTGAYPANQSDPREFAGGRKREPLQGAVPLQQFNTHVFAPPVTGAPIKKSKYSSGNLAAQGSIDPQNQSSPQSVFPAANASGQRICRQCGQVGRYKDGKCVEKWGPGPMGPGTVCDRCRKKMKRVERRGTLEAQQQQAQQAAQAQAQLAASIAAQAQAVVHASQIQQRQPLPTNVVVGLARTDTLPTNISTGSRSERDRPPKESHLRTQPSNANAPLGQREPTNGKPSSSSNAPPPLHRSPVDADRTDATDSEADADAEAEAEAEAEILGAASIAGANGGGASASARGGPATSKSKPDTAQGEVDELDGDGEADAEVDPEADLLEAVHAAEKNSSGGSVA